MTFIFDGTVQDFGDVFGPMLAGLVNEEFAGMFMHSCQEMNGTVKINISNGRYDVTFHAYGETDE